MLSWIGNNSSKYPQQGAGNGEVEAWTLISTPEYGRANKCPQEAIPASMYEKVSREMRDAFASILGMNVGTGEPAKKGLSMCSEWEILHLQLWGAALPLNVCGPQHFIHDPEAYIGVCGDWLTSPSVEGAIFSGLALAEAIDRQLRAGHCQCSKVSQFLGDASGHAIGSFGTTPTLTAIEAVDGKCVGSVTSAAASSVSTNRPNTSEANGSGIQNPPAARGSKRWGRQGGGGLQQQDSQAVEVSVSTGSSIMPSIGGTPQQTAAMTHQTASDGKTQSSRLSLPSCSAFAIQRKEYLVDIGANLGKCSPPDLARQLVRSVAAGVSRLVLTGCSVNGSLDAQRICDEWNGDAGMNQAAKHLGAAGWSEFLATGICALPTLAFTAGVHPHDAKSCNAQTIAALRKMASHRSCVSIGECGLDYDRMFSPREVQLEWCRKQVDLAVELGIPLFLHERDRDGSKGPPLGSARDLLGILKEARVESRRVCIHCFCGAADDLRTYIDQGFFIGLTGFVGMRQRGAHIRELVAKGAVPLDQLMIETDCPFMMPDKEFVPSELGLQGKKMEPCALPSVCNVIAELMKVSASEVARMTTTNAMRFFSL